jgi:hypothetical protein
MHILLIFCKFQICKVIFQSLKFINLRKIIFTYQHNKAIEIANEIIATG